MKMRLTDSKIAKLPAPQSGRVEYRDQELRGFALRITENCVRSWTLKTRAGGKQIRVTIPFDRFPTVESARTEARRLKGFAIIGRDPRSVIAIERMEAREIERAKLNRDSSTVQLKGRDFISHYAKKNQRSWRLTERLLEKNVFPEIGEFPIHSVRRSEIVDMLDKVEKRSGAAVADRTLAVLRKFFAWYAIRDDDFHSPIIRGMARTKPNERARSRILSDDEIRALWACTEKPVSDQASPGNTFFTLVRVLLLTACRRDEVSRMRRSEIDGDIWTIPAERYKTKRPHFVPITDGIAVELSKLPKSGKWVFTTTTKAPFSGFSKAKVRLDAAMHDWLEINCRADEKRAKIPEWRLHDLRRTARTLMSRAGVRPDIAERVLGHAVKGVEGVYDRHAYQQEKRDALLRLEAEIRRIIAPQTGNVVTMKSVG